MKGEKKRPRGLKSSAANKDTTKKAKTEVNNNEIPENAQTVVIDRVVEEGDEVGEAAALFEDAVSKIEKNPTEALALLRGTIHESDRILRNWSSEQSLPPLFYYTYGSALFELGFLNEDDEEELDSYLEAAEERLENGLDHFGEITDAKEKEKHEEVIYKIKSVLGKIWLAKASSSITESTNEIPELATKALDTLDKVISYPTISNDILISVANYTEKHGELYIDFSLRNKFTNLAEAIYKQILEKESDNHRVLSNLGLLNLSLANYWLERADENENDEENKSERNEEEQKAYDAILLAKKYLLEAEGAKKKADALSPQIYSDLAETYLNEANLIFDEEEQKKIYKDVVKYIGEAKLYKEKDRSDFILPEGLELFLEEWKDEE
ncbi:unnamed protein product [Cunninghamella blakesleeana]